MHPNNPSLSAGASQRGIALIVGLVILAVLSMIGIAAFSITTQEERMAGNSSDRMRAFENAEAALRGCENYLKANGASVFGSQPGMYPGPADSSSPSVAEQHPDEAWWRGSGNVLQVNVTGASYASPPSCIAESITLYPNANYTVGNALSSGPKTPGPTSVNIAHITAHGYGVNQYTVVRLESYYSM